MQRRYLYRNRTLGPVSIYERRLFVRSREVSKPRDWYFKLLYRFEIWQAHRQHCCRSACQISERSDNSKYKSRGFETLRDLTERRLFGYWDGALNLYWLPSHRHFVPWEYMLTTKPVQGRAFCSDPQRTNGDYFPKDIFVHLYLKFIPHVKQNLK